MSRAAPGGTSGRMNSALYASRGQRFGYRGREMDKFRAPQDLPPEFCQYRDEGCQIHPSCLDCPLPRCMYDEPGKSRQLKHRQRDAEIRRAHRAEGADISALVRRFRISRRTVYRILRRNDL